MKNNISPITTTEDQELIKEYPYQLETPRRLSESMLWQIQKEYFERKGSSAWVEGQVPHYITSNPFFANTYAQVIFGFLKDLHHQNKLDKPLQIIELGAGIGRFSFHFLKRLDELVHKEFQGLPTNCFRYIITDFTSKNLDFCKKHPKLTPFIERGLLDLAVFDITNSTELNLWESKEEISIENEEKNPIVLIGNYVFDTIPQDAFYIKDGVLYEMQATIYSNTKDSKQENILNNIRVNYDYNPVGIQYYEEAKYQNLLKQYQNQLAETSFLIPKLSLDCLEQVKKWSNGDFMLLSSDRGFLHEKDLFDQELPGIAIHDGCFSLPVNFHALNSIAENTGGSYLKTQHQHISLNTVVNLNKPKDKYPETQFAYQQYINHFGPDDFFVFTTTAGTNYPNMEAVQILAYWRLSRWDAKFFLESIPALNNKLDDIAEQLKTELYHALYKIWENFFPIGEDNDIDFQIGTVLFRLEHYQEAITFFENSLEHYGEDARTLSNMGLCYYFLKNYTESLKLMEKVVTLAPEHTTARKMIPTLKSVLLRS